jgi:hypothetical protein
VTWWGVLITAIVSAVGWFVGARAGANANYEKNRELQTQREDRERKGSLRRANGLLRIAIKSLEPFFYSFKNLQFNDVLRAWHKLEDLLDEPNTAIALEPDYPVLEDFLATFGRSIAMAQQESEKWDDPTSSSHNRPDRERRVYLADLFATPIPELQSAVEAVGSADVRADFTKLKQLINESRVANGYQALSD